MSGDAGGGIRSITEWGDPHAPIVVVAVHGRGQRPEFLRATSERFGMAAAPSAMPSLEPRRVRFVAPAAAGASWYPHPFLEPIRHNEPQLSRSLQSVQALIDGLVEGGIADDRIVLFGFSQGACLLSHLLLRGRRRYGGAILFTGGFVGAEAIDAPPSGAFAEMPAVIRSIENDPWVPPARVLETAALLAAAGALVDVRIEAGREHIITDEACSAAASLLGRLVAADGRQDQVGWGPNPAPARERSKAPLRD